MTAFVIRWLVTTIAVLVAAHLIPGISYDGWGALLGASLLLGIINAFVRPILLLLSLPFIIITMGLFIFVINALLLMLVSKIVPAFQVAGFWSAFFGAIVISLGQLDAEFVFPRERRKDSCDHAPHGDQAGQCAGDRMTYCLSLHCREGLVFLSDTRTSAGVDNVTTHSKMRVYEVTRPASLLPAEFRQLVHHAIGHGLHRTRSREGQRESESSQLAQSAESL